MILESEAWTDLPFSALRMIDDTSVRSSNGSLALSKLLEGSGAGVTDTLERGLAHLGLGSLGSLFKDVSDEFSTWKSDKKERTYQES